MKINRSTSIRTRFIILLSMVITLIMITIGASTIYIQSNQRTKNLNERADLIMQQLSVVLQAPLWESEKDVIDKTINSYLVDRIIISIKVKENDEVISFVSKSTEFMNLNNKHHFTSNGTVISKIGDKIGDFEVCFTRSPLEKFLKFHFF